MGSEDWPDRAPARDEPVIVSDAGTLGGVPRFRGTDVGVEEVFAHLAHGASLDTILAAFPALDRADCVAALWQGMRVLQERAYGERAMRESAERGDPDID